MKRKTKVKSEAVLKKEQARIITKLHRKEPPRVNTERKREIKNLKKLKPEDMPLKEFMKSVARVNTFAYIWCMNKGLM